MATANPGDLFVVNRDDTTYSVRQDELMALIQPTDHMVINRNDVTYKITGEEVIDSFIPGIILDEVIINNTNPKTRDTIAVTITVSGGQPPYTVAYVWKYRNQTTGIPETVIDDIITSSLYIPDELAGSQFACEVTYTDNRGSSETKQSDYTEAAILYAEGPILDNVNLTLASSGTNRFTNETYSAQVTLASDGVPSSTKAIFGYCDGSFVQSTQSAPIMSVESKPSNYLSRLTTNDPQGVLFADNLFNGITEQYAKVRMGYYIQFEFPYPIPWRGDKDIYSSSADGSIGTYMAAGQVNVLAADYTDDVIGPSFQRIETWAAGGWGAAVVDARFSEGARYITEINAIRYYDAAGSPGSGGATLLSYLKSDEHEIYTGPTNPSILRGMYLSDDIFYTITLQSDENLQYLEEGDEISETGGSAIGTVYKLDRANRQIVLTKYSDRTWTVGSTITIPAKPVLDNRLYLVLDSSGNVTDLDKNKPLPVYQSTEQNPEFLLKFPLTFPGGLTPDEELVGNTRLTVEVLASNPEGSSGPLAASINPGGSGFNINDVFSTTLYTGNEANFRSINTGVNLNAGLAWIKGRSGAHPLVHRWHDSERSPSAPSRYIESNSDSPEGDAPGTVTDLYDGGFELGPDTTLNKTNIPYAAWSFGKNRFFFDIVTYTGNGQGGRNLSHKLFSTPGMIIVKPLTGHSGNDNWIVYHKDSANSSGSATQNFGILNEDREFSPTGGTNWPAGNDTNVWQNTAPTSTEFTLGTSPFVNETGRKYVAYLFASEAGGFGPDSVSQVIKCGSYVGNGGSQLIEMNFQPAFVMIKSSTGSRGWYMADSTRGWDKALTANADNSENDYSSGGIAVSNGFNLVGGDSLTNGIGTSYVYLAISE